MAIKVASHLKRNRFGLLYFRRVIPPDVRGFFAFKEISRSTGTSRRGEAAALALRLGATLDLLFERLRQMAKNKNPEGDQVGLIIKLAFDKDGTLKSLFTDAAPGEEEAAGRLVPQFLQVAQTGQPAKGSIPLDGPRLGAEVDKYIDEHARSGSWADTTVLDVRGDFDQFKAILGDVPVATLRHDALNRLRDTLLRLPANANKLKETRGKSIDEMLALGLPPQKANTVKKKWTRLISFFDWLEGQGLVDRNYARGKKPKAKAQSYEKFTRDDLSLLFENDDYRNGLFKEAFQYWMPVLGLYTGARLEELAQLHLADICQDSGTSIWIVNITDEVDEEEGADTAKNLKNEGSKRTVPLHQAVLSAGLLTYVEDLKQRGYDRLFPELAPDAQGKIGPRATESFTKYRRSKGVGALKGKSQKAFHSFRHSMNSTLQKAGVAQEIREALCGHASQAVNLKVYGGDFVIRQLKDAIERLDYGIDIPAFIARDEHDRARMKTGRRNQNEKDRPSTG